MWGWLEVEPPHDIRDLVLFASAQGNSGDKDEFRPKGAVRQFVDWAAARTDSINLRGKARKNAEHTYNLTRRLYELFLDENGQKISKSKGNGLTIDEWLTYAPTESLALYMFQRPRQAKKLYFDVIPKAVDEYYAFLSACQRQDWKERLGNPVWHIHSGNPPAIDLPVSFALLLNLVSASNAQNKDVLWGFISRYAPGVTAATHPELDRLTGYAIRYFDDFVKPSKVYRAADAVEREALAALSDALGALPADADGEAIQNAALNVARKVERYQDHAKRSPEGGPGVSVAFFQMIYQVLIGQERGPRFGSFAALYGIGETRALIERALAGKLAAA